VQQLHGYDALVQGVGVDPPELKKELSP